MARTGSMGLAGLPPRPRGWRRLGGHVRSARRVRRACGAALGTPQREVLVARDRRLPDAARRRLMVPARTAARLRPRAPARRGARAGGQGLSGAGCAGMWAAWCGTRARGRRPLASTRETTCGPRERPMTAAEPPASHQGPQLRARLQDEERGRSPISVGRWVSTPPSARTG